ncbi:hypothetical protein [Streptomyces virginiae]|uniref:hypothetical protein n=1 Tax=Streptomyces virginiae TaxID=1961 RepID=UPI00345229E0
MSLVSGPTGGLAVERPTANAAPATPTRPPAALAAITFLFLTTVHAAVAAVAALAAFAATALWPVRKPLATARPTLCTSTPWCRGLTPSGVQSRLRGKGGHRRRYPQGKSPSQRGGQKSGSSSSSERTKGDLCQETKERGIEGRSTITKQQLKNALGH